jgi:hypothetical protein
LRGKPSLAASMRPISKGVVQARNKAKGAAKDKGKIVQPNFYKMPFLPKVTLQSEPRGSELREQRDLTTASLLNTTPPTIVGATIAEANVGHATLAMAGINSATMAWYTSAFHPPPSHHIFATLLAPALAHPTACLTTTAAVAAAPVVVVPPRTQATPLSQAAMQTVFGNSSLSRRDEHRALVSQFLPRPPTRRADVADDLSILALIRAHQVLQQQDHLPSPPSAIAHVNGGGRQGTNTALDSLGLWPRRS